MFGDEPKIQASFSKDPAITEREPQGSYEAGLLELYKKKMCIRDRYYPIPKRYRTFYGTRKVKKMVYR